MIDLEHIKSDIQNIAEAIVSVLGIDVTIVDHNLVRIAGTGIYLKKVGEKVNGYSAFKKSLDEQIGIIIDDPSSNEICKECYNKLECKEVAEVSCPIVCDGISYGVIGLIAFSKEQGNIIKNEKKCFDELFREDGRFNF